MNYESRAHEREERWHEGVDGRLGAHEYPHDALFGQYLFENDEAVAEVWKECV